MASIRAKVSDEVYTIGDKIYKNLFTSSKTTKTMRDFVAKYKSEITWVQVGAYAKIVVPDIKKVDEIAKGTYLTVTGPVRPCMLESLYEQVMPQSPRKLVEKGLVDEVTITSTANNMGVYKVVGGTHLYVQLATVNTKFRELTTVGGSLLNNISKAKIDESFGEGFFEGACYKITTVNNKLVALKCDPKSSYKSKDICVHVPHGRTLSQIFADVVTDTFINNSISKVFILGLVQKEGDEVNVMNTYISELDIKKYKVATNRSAMMSCEYVLYRTSLADVALTRAYKLTGLLGCISTKKPQLATLTEVVEKDARERLIGKADGNYKFTCSSVSNVDDLTPAIHDTYNPLCGGRTVDDVYHKTPLIDVDEILDLVPTSSEESTELAIVDPNVENGLYVAFVGHLIDYPERDATEDFIKLSGKPLQYDESINSVEHAYMYKCGLSTQLKVRRSQHIASFSSKSYTPVTDSSYYETIPLTHCRFHSAGLKGAETKFFEGATKLKGVRTVKTTTGYSLDGIKKETEIIVVNHSAMRDFSNYVKMVHNSSADIRYVYDLVKLDGEEYVDTISRNCHADYHTIMSNHVDSLKATFNGLLNTTASTGMAAIAMATRQIEVGIEERNNLHNMYRNEIKEYKEEIKEVRDWAEKKEAALKAESEKKEAALKAEAEKKEAALKADLIKKDERIDQLVDKLISTKRK